MGEGPASAPPPRFVEAASERRPPNHGEDDEASSLRPRTGAAEVPSAPPAREPRRRRSTDGFLAILMKEFFHIQRQPSTLFVMLVIPVLQTIIFGVAIDTQVEDIPTVVYDLDGRREARELVEAFENSNAFEVVLWVHDEESFGRAMTSGRPARSTRRTRARPRPRRSWSPARSPRTTAWARS